MELIKIGQTVSLFFQKEEKLVEIVCTISKLYDDRMAVELPQYFMRYIGFLSAGKRLTAKVFSKLGTIDFNSVIISSPLEEEFILELDYNAMKLTPGEEIPVIGAIETLNIIKSDEIIKMRTFEISTEYIKFYGNKNFNIDDELNCELILPENYGTISFKATVTEKDPEYDNEYTASYYNMTEDDRQTLLYYMYVYANETTTKERERFDGNRSKKD